jgi:hypothetical protein
MDRKSQMNFGLFIGLFGLTRKVFKKQGVMQWLQAHFQLIPHTN